MKCKGRQAQLAFNPKTAEDASFTDPTLHDVFTRQVPFKFFFSTSYLLLFAKQYLTRFTPSLTYLH